MESMGCLCSALYFVRDILGDSVGCGRIACAGAAESSFRCDWVGRVLICCPWSAVSSGGSELYEVGCGRCEFLWSSVSGG